jgi:hypothetical protein
MYFAVCVDTHSAFLCTRPDDTTGGRSLPCNSGVSASVTAISQ